MELPCSLPCLQQPATDSNPDHMKQYPHKHTHTHTSITFSKSMPFWLSLSFLTLSTLNRTKNLVTFLLKTYPQNADCIAHSTHIRNLFSYILFSINLMQGCSHLTNRLYIYNSHELAVPLFFYVLLLRRILPTCKTFYQLVNLHVRMK